MNEMLALACKDLRLLLRDKVGFIFVFFFPLVYAIGFGLMFKGQEGPQAVPIVYVDEDGTEASRELLASLGATGDFRLTRSEDRAAAEDLVRRGRKAAYVVVPQGFGEARRRMFFTQCAPLELGADPSRKAQAGMLQGLLLQSVFGGMSKAFKNPASIRGAIQEDLESIKADPELSAPKKLMLGTFLAGLDAFLATVPSVQQLLQNPAEAEPAAGGAEPGVARDEPAAGSGWQPLSVVIREVTGRKTGVLPPATFAITFPQSISWALIGCAAAFAISIVAERSGGTLLRLQTAPVSRGHVLGGKALACFLTTVAASGLLLVVARVAFGVEPQSWLLLALAVVSSCACFVGIMMLLSVIGRTEAAAAGIGWAVMLVLAMLGGGMMPRDFMPGFMKTISHVSPVKWAIQAMEGAIWRGFGPSEMLPACAILLTLGLATFLVGARMIRAEGA
ncbi:MAG: ABC transporter permease [Phycisphaerales bacterium]|nr:MAG: ABC transporter permease [Phycisphaerales bacterium]